MLEVSGIKTPGGPGIEFDYEEVEVDPLITEKFMPGPTTVESRRRLLQEGGDGSESKEVYLLYGYKAKSITAAEIAWRNPSLIPCRTTEDGTCGARGEVSFLYRE